MPIIFVFSTIRTSSAEVKKIDGVDIEKWAYLGNHLDFDHF